MRAAISSLLFKSHSLEQVIGLAHAVGVSWLEVWTEHFWRDDQGDLIGKLKRSGLDLSVHGPIGDLNITSSNEGIRKESVRQVLKGIEEAAAMGARVISVHPGYLTGRQDEPEGIWDMQIEALKRFSERGRDLGLVVAMETIERRSKEVVIQPEIANRITDAVDMDNLRRDFRHLSWPHGDGRGGIHPGSAQDQPHSHQRYQGWQSPHAHGRGRNRLWSSASSAPA